MLDPDRRAFIEGRRTATLATISKAGLPRLVPICFVLADEVSGSALPVLYSPLDEKPKRSADVHDLARVRDIIDRPMATLLFERWDEDWTRLAWVRATGTASIVEPGERPTAHRRLAAAMRDKYPQYRDQSIETSPMIRVVLEKVTAWSAEAGWHGS
ncbi:MAG: TIGR03668 family PPOX class F420-dependent oxidoreductase [Candidatus Limnocylindrales bacterium]